MAQHPGGLKWMLSCDWPIASGDGELQVGGVVGSTTRAFPRESRGVLVCPETPRFWPREYCTITARFATE